VISWFQDLLTNSTCTTTAGLVSISYLILAAAASASNAGTGGGGKMGAGWLVLHLTVLTAGELYLSPVGLSFMTVVAPRELASMMMGVWFLSSFLGNYLSGELGALYAYMVRKTKSHTRRGK
jgi:POT family proton-dependent oligopeptide transporter